MTTETAQVGPLYLIIQSYPRDDHTNKLHLRANIKITPTIFTNTIPQVCDYRVTSTPPSTYEKNRTSLWPWAMAVFHQPHLPSPPPQSLPRLLKLLGSPPVPQISIRQFTLLRSSTNSLPPPPQSSCRHPQRPLQHISSPSLCRRLHKVV